MITINSPFLRVTCQVFSTLSWRCCLSSSIYLWLTCQKSGDYMYVDLHLGPWSSFIDYCAFCGRAMQRVSPCTSWLWQQASTQSTGDKDRSWALMLLSISIRRRLLNMHTWSISCGLLSKITKVSKPCGCVERRTLSPCWWEEKLVQPLM